MARIGLSALVAWVSLPSVGGAQQPTTQEQVSGTEALLQAVSPASDRVVWVSGHEGAVLRTTDGGETWEVRPVPSLDSLQFRDVHGFGSDRAVILSAGTGPQSRVYSTDDGGRSWALRWLNPEPEGFYDCLDFWDDERGVLYGDAVDGGLRILLTDDGGENWRRVPSDRLPLPAGPEGGFAASGTCVRVGPDGTAWIATGAGDRARVLRTADYGERWDAVDVPLVSGEAAGGFSVVHTGGATGLVFGGDLSQAEAFTDNAIRTTDGGATWTLSDRPSIAGAVYGADRFGPLILVAGPNGLAFSAGGDAPWTTLDSGSFWAVGASASAAWAVGPAGRILRLSLP